MGYKSEVSEKDDIPQNKACHTGSQRLHEGARTKKEKDERLGLRNSVLGTLFVP